MAAGFIVWLVALAGMMGVWTRLLRAAGLLPPDLRPPFTISPDTTLVTAPLDAYGWPDYAAALNEQWSRDVTPETNFAVAEREIMGPDKSLRDASDRYDEALGLTKPISSAIMFRDPKTVLPHLTDENIVSERVMATPWTDAEFPDIARLLDANNAALDTLVGASKRPRCYLPIIPNRSIAKYPADIPLFEVPLNALGRLNFPMRQLLARINRADRPVSAGQAIDDLVAPLRVAWHVSHTGFLIHAYVGSSFEQMSLVGLTSLLNRPEVTEEDLVLLLHELDALPPRTTVADVLPTSELCFALDYLTHAARTRTLSLEDMGHSTNRAAAIERCLRYGAIDWDLALKTLQQHYHELARIARLSSRSKQAAEFSALRLSAAAPSAPWGTAWGAVVHPLFGSRKSNAQALVSALVEILSGLGMATFEIDRRMDARYRLVRLAIAVRRHSLRTGLFPATPADLPAELRPANLADPFLDPGDLHYRLTPEGCLLYSVGSNGRDDLGEDAVSSPNTGADDIAIRLINPVPGSPDEK